MTPQRKRAVEMMAKLMEHTPDYVEDMAEFESKTSALNAGLIGWERAIVAEGFLERWMLSAKRDDFVTIDVDLQARHAAYKAESLDALVADTRSFLSAEGE